MNSVGSYLYHWLFNGPDKWYPLVGVYYLTYACHLRCKHCSDGSGIPYHQMDTGCLPADQAVEVCRRMRKHCDYLVITGGEPLIYQDADRFLHGLSQLRYRGTILTTNGQWLHTHMESIVKSVNYLVVSLQTLNSSKGDEWYGGIKGLHQKVINNLESAAGPMQKKGEVIISTVVTPENIPDMYDLYHYTQKRRFRLAACPQLAGVKANEGLVNNRDYIEFYNFLIREKKRGGKIEGTVDYLRHMRDLAQFKCRPFTMLVVSPLGDVFYPCLEIGKKAGNLLEQHDLHQIRRDAFQKLGPQPRCGTQCHSACALGFSRLLDNPLSLVSEAACMARGSFRNFCQG